MMWIRPQPAAEQHFVAPPLPYPGQKVACQIQAGEWRTIYLTYTKHRRPSNGIFTDRVFWHRLEGEKADGNGAFECRLDIGTRGNGASMVVANVDKLPAAVFQGGQFVFESNRIMA